uniref:Uncharacterized protein n=1 Tax=Candidatus Kentrum sp. FM TaxID=2126340 RepID=A0A450WNF7_9GAMM|nr:MAG: hypothetical protein BECKFM1743A_GA0114220_105902 [Candidatus Kentron sp. FM]VFJ77295.1 MAG: hypothetical protein BECKFM1743C_GA0114222_109722 [Candidatus Kentron sp. FM]VFK18591.1 MAG: hypothetical protein BECKFM1743B_GA0114221_105592 [Candidatus Kentron sp. FM]
MSARAYPSYEVSNSAPESSEMPPATPQQQRGGYDDSFTLQAIIELQKTTGYLTSAVESLKDVVESSNRNMEKRFEASEKRFESLQNAMDRRFESLQDAMDRRFESMQDATERRFESLQDATGRRFESMQNATERRFESMQNAIEKQNEHQNKRMAALEGKVSELSKKIYAAGVILTILVGIGGFIANKSWTLMSHQIALRDQPMQSGQSGIPGGE